MLFYAVNHLLNVAMSVAVKHTDCDAEGKRHYVNKYQDILTKRK